MCGSLHFKVTRGAANQTLGLDRRRWARKHFSRACERARALVFTAGETLEVRENLVMNSPWRGSQRNREELYADAGKIRVVGAPGKNRNGGNGKLDLLR